jgi:phage/plasmid-like protein (TIGR03299 family)
MPAEVDHLSYVANERLAKTGLPWWGNGTSAKERKLDDWITKEQALEVIGWPVRVQPLYRKTKWGQFLPVDDQQETVRADTDEHIACVGSDYRAFGGDQLISFCEELVDHQGGHYDTVASLRNQRLIVATIRLDVVSEALDGLKAIDGSDYWTWLQAHASHDGATGIGLDVTCIRCVCLNTFRAGRQAAKASWNVRHTGDVGTRVQEARSALNLVTKAQDQFAEAATALAQVDFKVDEFEAFINEVLPQHRVDGKEFTKANLKRRIQTQEDVRNNWLYSTTIADDIRFTGWGLVNGVGEWAEHENGIKATKSKSAEERRFLSTCFGGPIEQLRDKTIEVVSRKLVNA